MEKLARVLNDYPSSKILDVGTGTGNFVSLITSCFDNYESIIGIDTIEGAVNIANKNFEDDRIHFELMDGTKTNYKDDYFDIVCLSNSLHHLNDIEKLFSEMKRIVKKDGIILVSEMISNGLNSKQMSHLKIHHFAAKTDRLRGDIHNDTYSDEQIFSILKDEAQLEIVKSWTLRILKAEDEDLPDRFKWFEDTVSRLIKRIPEELQTDELKEEGHQIVEYIKEHGFDSCPTVIVVMRK